MAHKDMKNAQQPHSVCAPTPCLVGMGTLKRRRTQHRLLSVLVQTGPTCWERSAEAVSAAEDQQC